MSGQAAERERRGERTLGEIHWDAYMASLNAGAETTTNLPYDALAGDARRAIEDGAAAVAAHVVNPTAADYDHAAEIARLRSALADIKDGYPHGTLAHDTARTALDPGGRRMSGQTDPWQVIADTMSELLRGGQTADIRCRAALRVMADAGIDFDGNPVARSLAEPATPQSAPEPDAAMAAPTPRVDWGRASGAVAGRDAEITRLRALLASARDALGYAWREIPDGPVRDRLDRELTALTEAGVEAPGAGPCDGGDGPAGDPQALTAAERAQLAGQMAETRRLASEMAREDGDHGDCEPTL